jgi:hypothetical protein
MFILDVDDLDPKEIKRRFEAYFEYLRREAIPDKVRRFAAADWYYNPSDHRCPHDSWVNEVTVLEVPACDDICTRSMAIRVSLLGAYHNGRILYHYDNVRSYSLCTPPDCQFPKLNAPPGIGHGDWLRDEVRTSERNLLLHEIVFSRGSRWLIEAENIEYVWQPLSSSDGVMAGGSA